MLGGQTMLILKVQWRQTLPVVNHIVVNLLVVSILFQYQGSNNQREVYPVS